MTDNSPATDELIAQIEADLDCPIDGFNEIGIHPDHLRSLIARIRAETAKNSGEPIGYIAEHELQNLKNNCFYASLARVKNGVQRIPVFLATPANSRAEAIGAAKDALKSLIECKDAFDASDANQAEAYYKLVKYAYPAWEKARTALALFDKVDRA